MPLSVAAGAAIGAAALRTLRILRFTAGFLTTAFFAAGLRAVFFTAAFRAGFFAVDFLAAAFFAAGFRAAVFLPAGFRAVFLTAFLAAFLAAGFLAAFFAAGFLVAFLDAVFFTARLDVFFAAGFLVVAFLAAGFFAAFFAADFLAAVFLAGFFVFDFASAIKASSCYGSLRRTLPSATFGMIFGSSCARMQISSVVLLTLRALADCMHVSERSTTNGAPFIRFLRGNVQRTQQKCVAQGSNCSRWKSSSIDSRLRIRCQLLPSAITSAARGRVL